MEVDETTEEAAKREAKEEICVDARIADLFGVFSYNDDPRGNGVIIIYRAQIDGNGVPLPRDSVSQVGFFNPHQLPEQIAFGHHRTILNKWLSDFGSSMEQKNLQDLNQTANDYRYRDQLMIQEFSIGVTAISVLLNTIFSPDRHTFFTFDVLILLIIGEFLLYTISMHLSRINKDRVNSHRFMHQLEEELGLRRLQFTRPARKGSVPTLMVAFFWLLNVLWTIGLTLWLYILFY